MSTGGGQALLQLVPAIIFGGSAKAELEGRLDSAGGDGGVEQGVAVCFELIAPFLERPYGDDPPAFTRVRGCFQSRSRAKGIAFLEEDAFAGLGEMETCFAQLSVLRP